MDIRRATRDEEEQIATLLHSTDLPPLPTEFSVSDVLVALDGEAVVGAAGLEFVARLGALSFLTVAPSVRRQGIGSSLLQSAVARANELGLSELYLLTDREKGFFEKRGFAAVAEEDVPVQVRSNTRYRDPRSDTDHAMRLSLETRYL